MSTKELESTELIPLNLVQKTLEEYYTDGEVTGLLSQVLRTLKLKARSFYPLPEFVRICHELKDCGGNARFCGSILIIKAITHKAQPGEPKEG